MIPGASLSLCQDVFVNVVKKLYLKGSSSFYNCGGASMFRRSTLVLAILALFVAAIGAPPAAGRTTQQEQVTVIAGPPAPAVVAQPDAAPSGSNGIPVETLLTPDGRLRLEGTVQGRSTSAAGR